jgi:hypothetical protein
MGAPPRLAAGSSPSPEGRGEERVEPTMGRSWTGNDECSRPSCSPSNDELAPCVVALIARDELAPCLATLIAFGVALRTGSKAVDSTS